RWRPGSGGRVVCSAWFGVGAGEADEGDFEAEVAELADVVGDLAADAALALVVVRAEVGIAHAGVGQQLVVDLQLGVADGDLGLGFAAAAGQPAVAGALAGLGAPGRDGGLAGDRAQVPVALLGLGPPLALAGLVVEGGAACPGGQVGAGGKPGHIRAGLGEGVLGGAAPPAG